MSELSAYEDEIYDHPIISCVWWESS